MSPLSQWERPSVKLANGVERIRRIGLLRGSAGRSDAGLPVRCVAEIGVLEFC